MTTKDQVVAMVEQLFRTMSDEPVRNHTIDFRIACFLVAADLAHTTETTALADLLGEAVDQITQWRESARAQGIFCEDGGTDTAHYWRPGGVMGLLCDVLCVLGRAVRAGSNAEGEIVYRAAPRAVSAA